MMNVVFRRDAAGVGALAVATVLAASGTCRAQWSDYAHYQIQRIGLYGAEHTASDGTQTVNSQFLSSSGHVVGTSLRYSGTSTRGSNPWIWTGTGTVQLGFFGGQHRGTTGTEISTLAGLSDGGQAAGFSYRFAGVNTFAGADSWVWNGSQTIRIGIDDAAHTNVAGVQESRATLQNAGGQVAGFSTRYSGVNSVGRTAWVWSSGTLTPIGLGASSYSYNEPRFQNASGIVAGTSATNISENSANYDALRDAWAWNGTTTQRIGLIGAEYQGQHGAARFCEPRLLGNGGHIVGIAARGGEWRASGFYDSWIWDGSTTTRIGLVGARYGSGTEQNSVPLFLNDAGIAVGTSTSFLSLTTTIGNDTWVWNGAASVRINLEDGVYTNGVNAYRDSEPTHLNASGHVAGWSTRYRGSAGVQNGQGAWVWDGATTQQIGLSGGAYTTALGRQVSTPVLMNAASQIVGTSLRYTPSAADNGQDAWVWRNNITSPVGLTGGVYEGSAGFRISTPRFQNEAGIVVGTSNRIGGISDIVGTDAWYFDPASGVTSSIIGSVRSTDGFTGITLRFLTETGFLLGNYRYFEGGLGDGVDRAFVFRPDLGLADLGDLVEGGLGEAGWSELLFASRSIDLQYIIGRGLVDGQSLGGSAFIMVLPAPGSMAAFGVLVALMGRRRR